MAADQNQLEPQVTPPRFLPPSRSQIYSESIVSTSRGTEVSTEANASKTCLAQDTPEAVHVMYSSSSSITIYVSAKSKLSSCNSSRVKQSFSSIDTTALNVAARKSPREQSQSKGRLLKTTKAIKNFASESYISRNSQDDKNTGALHIESSVAQGDDWSPISTSTEFVCQEPSEFCKDSKINEFRARDQIMEGHRSGMGILEKNRKNCSRANAPKRSRPCSPKVNDDEVRMRKIREIHFENQKSIQIIKDSRLKILDFQAKQSLTEANVKEMHDVNSSVLREMERLERLTKRLQELVGTEVGARVVKDRGQPCSEYVPGSVHEPPLYYEMKMNHPTVLLTGGKPHDRPGLVVCETPARSKSEIDLTRRLSESYDMQEKLVDANAALEVKRYILYKELMTKDQNLETCQAQIKRLQGEMKLMDRENQLLHEKLLKNNPEGDATEMNKNSSFQQEDIEDCSQGSKKNHKQLEILEVYQNLTSSLETQIQELEGEVHLLRANMDALKGGSGCRGGGGQNTCFKQPAGGPPVPSMSRACGVCPPCPAPCNPNAPPTPAEKEVQKLTIQLKQTEENFKTKVTECAMLRAELVKKKEELEREKCQHREVQNRLRELEMKFEGLTTQTNMALGSKEQAFEQEVNVRALKQCYREARDEIEELRMLMKEQNDQLQDYRVKYLQAQQLVEEQRRQMDTMDMDNTRISEQINLEIQRVKLKFQEKLQELAPIPDLLKATQLKLKDAQQSQAIAEHNAEQLARELNCAREKVHVLLHNSLKPPEKPSADKSGEEKQIALLQQRVSQLTETNAALKSDVERLKMNLIRMEECTLANDKRLQEKMHECAQLGGELDRARDEAARALQRANERTETIRKCLQTTVAELERQLASTRAQVATAQKEREELQSRMQCQIKRLNENFEQGQLRILGLQTQVQALRRTASSNGDGEGEGDADQQECACKTFFDDK